MMPQSWTEQSGSTRYYVSGVECYTVVVQVRGLQVWAVARSDGKQADAALRAHTRYCRATRWRTRADGRLEARLRRTR
jgi:hypothetical protein